METRVCALPLLLTMTMTACGSPPPPRADVVAVSTPAPAASAVCGRSAQKSDGAHRLARRIGVLTGHGELSLKAMSLVQATELSPSRVSLEQVITKSFPSIVLVDVDLRGGTAPIDDSLTGLLVTQPTADLNETELRALDRFVMTEKPVAVFASSANVAQGDETMRVTLGAHGLDRWLGGYGVELRRDLVLDPASSISIPTQTSAGIKNLVLPQFPRVTRLDPASPFFVRVADLAMPFASSLVVHRERQPRATYAILAQSSDSARSETRDGVVLDTNLDHPVGAGGAHGRLDLAVSVGGALGSAFPGASPPRAAAARLVVFGSSELLGNPFGIALDAPPKDSDPASSQLSSLGQLYVSESITQVVLTFKNTLDWMIDEGQPALCQPAAGPLK